MKKIGLTFAGAALVASSAIAATYTVQEGDWLSKIAIKTGHTTQQLADLNPQIKNIALIYPGQIINLDSGSKKAEATQKVAEEKVVAKADDAKSSYGYASEEKAAKPCSKCDQVINGNPLYRPAQGHFYSITTLGTDTAFKTWTLAEEFGYGITDRLSAIIATAGISNEEFEKDIDGNYAHWNNFSAGLSFRYLNDRNWKGDVYGNMMFTSDDLWKSEAWEEEYTHYNWNVGTKFGYTNCDWTLNGLFEYGYANTEAFNWDEKDFSSRSYTVGLEGQYVFAKHWNVVAGVKYIMPDYQDANYYNGKIGVNYNIDATKYLGVYAFQNLGEKSGDFDDDTGLALQFGIDF